MPRKFDIGNAVIVLELSEYKSKYKGEQGVIESMFKRRSHIMYGVKLSDRYNQSSGKGLFWFEARSLDFINPEDNIESEENEMFENFNVAQVSFLDNPVPVYYYAIYDPDIKVDDVVVVRTGHHGFALATVRALSTDMEDKKKVTCNREVVSKVDFTAFNARKDALKRVRELKKDMDAKIQEVQTLGIYELFAEKDPALKAMLEEFKKLSALIKGETHGEASE